MLLTVFAQQIVQCVVMPAEAFISKENLKFKAASVNFFVFTKRSNIGVVARSDETYKDLISLSTYFSILFGFRAHRFTVCFSLTAPNPFSRCSFFNKPKVSPKDKVKE